MNKYSGPKIKESRLQALEQKVERAQKELDQYNEWFDSLTVGMVIFENLAYDDSPVKVLGWDKHTGEVVVEYDSAGIKVTRSVPYWRLSKERQLLFG